MNGVYLDNNATTPMSAKAQDALIRWCNRGNPSASYRTAIEARAMMTAVRQYIGKLCSVTVCCAEDRDTGDGGGGNLVARGQGSNYKVIFTSGASEANCTILRGVVESYAHACKYNVRPHVIISAIEHKSLISMAESFAARGQIDLTLVPPTSSGHITPAQVSAAITPRTCLIAVMHANNETGAINDVAAIGKIAHSGGIAFHCDTVQTFGKDPIQPLACGIDSFCISFHKFGGPPGIGALIVKQELLKGYKIAPLIFGTQNEGLRGGTENLPGIGASAVALVETMRNRQQKNAGLAALKKQLLDALSNIYSTLPYYKYDPSANWSGIVFFSGMAGYLNNTVLLSVVANKVCNVEIKNNLEKAGIIVSIGSACNTASKTASHVLYAMGADERIRRGALRISLGDNNTAGDIRAFIREFVLATKKYF